MADRTECALTQQKQLENQGRLGSLLCSNLLALFDHGLCLVSHNATTPLFAIQSRVIVHGAEVLGELLEFGNILLRHVSDSQSSRSFFYVLTVQGGLFL